MLTSTRAPKGLADDVRRLFGPDKRRRVGVPLREIALDVADESADRVEGAPAHRFAREDAESRLHHIEPGGPGRCEVKAHARVLRTRKPRPVGAPEHPPR